MEKLFTFITLFLWCFTPILINAQNNALDFNGSSNYIQVDNFPNLATWTVECWVKGNHIPTNTNNNGVVYKGNNFRIIWDDNTEANQGAVTVVVGGISYVASFGTLKANEWYHLTGTYDGQNLRAYTNGVLITTNSLPSGNSNSDPTPLKIGSQELPSKECFEGTIDEVRIWEGARTVEQIRANMYLELSGDESNLMAYYQMDELSGTVAKNSQTGGSFDGTLQGFDFTNNNHPSSAFYGSKNALDFDGDVSNTTGDYIEINPILNPSAVDGFAVEAWINPDDWANYGRILEAGQAWIGINRQGLIYSYLDTKGFNAGVTATINEWTHCAVIYDGTTLRMLINGVVKKTIITSEVINSTSNMLIGWNGYWTNTHFNGKMDEIRIWNVYRNESQIRENMCKTLSGNEEGLEAYYNFDNTSGTILQDFSGNGHDGTLHNMVNPDNNWVKSGAFNTWLNVNNTSFTTNENWSEGTAPTATDNLGITYYPGGSQPTIDSDGESNLLMTGSNTTLTFASDNSYYIEGNLFNEGTLLVNKGNLINNNTSATCINNGTLINNGSMEFNNLTNNTGKTIDINAGKEMAINGNFSNAGTFTIHSSASGTGILIQATDGVKGTVENYIADGGWHLISPSTTGATVNDFYWNNAPQSWVTQHTESTNEWTYMTDLNESMNVGQGYSVWIDDATKSDVTVSTTGNMRATDYTPDITYTAANGWNLVGNPFTSAIDWAQGSWVRENIELTMYVWDNATNNYLTHTTQGGGTKPDGVIPLGQGFFVRSIASSPKLTIPADARIGAPQGIYKSPSENKYESYAIITAKKDGNADGVWVSFGENGTDDFENGWDASKLMGGENSPQLYLTQLDRKLSINHLATLEKNERIVSMSFRAGMDGEQHIIANLENIPNTDISLEDKQTGKFHDLVKNPEYIFTASVDDNPDRFNLHFQSKTSGIEPNFLSSEVTVYSNAKNIYIISEGEALNYSGSIEVVDTFGRTILKQQLDKSNRIIIPVSTESGCFIVRVIKGNVINTKKIFIN